jgi:hypothetical protein
MSWPEKIKAYEVITMKPGNNRILLRRVEKMIEFYKPEVIVLRDCDTKSSSKRIVQLTKAISLVTEKNHIPLFRYSRKRVQEIFEILSKMKTKYEIAYYLIKGFPVLASIAPKTRKAWLPEDYNWAFSMPFP